MSPVNNPGDLTPMTSSTFFVTGASGFIGQALITRLLEQGHHILAAYDSGSTIESPIPASVLPVNLDDRAQLRSQLLNCDCVVNLSLNPENLQFRTAIEETQTLLQACIEAQVKKFIHISSTDVYGDPPPSRVITEASPYLASLKLQSSIQQALERLVLQVEAENIEVIVLQLGRVYGPGVGGETAQLLSQMKTVFLPLVRQGSGYCHPIYIDDVITAILRAWEVPNLHQQRFIISPDQPVCWSELLSSYESILGQKSLVALPIDYPCEVQTSMSWMKAIASKALKKRKVMQTTSAIAKAACGKSIYYPSVDEFRTLVAQPIFLNQKSRDRLNFQPQISFQTGIERIREWWSQNPLEAM